MSFGIPCPHGGSRCAGDDDVSPGNGQSSANGGRTNRVADNDYSLVKDGTLAKRPFRSGAALSRGRVRDFTGSRGQAIAGASGVLRPQASRPVAQKRDLPDGADAPEHVSRTGSAGVGCTVHRLGAGATPPSGPSRQALALREH